MYESSPIVAADCQSLLFNSRTLSAPGPTGLSLSWAEFAARAFVLTAAVAAMASSFGGVREDGIALSLVRHMVPPRFGDLMNSLHFRRAFHDLDNKVHVPIPDSASLEFDTKCLMLSASWRTSPHADDVDANSIVDVYTASMRMCPLDELQAEFTAQVATTFLCPTPAEQDLYFEVLDFDRLRLETVATLAGQTHPAFSDIPRDKKLLLSDLVLAASAALAPAF